MSFDTLQFQELISTVLNELDPIIPNSDSALMLLAGTAAQESHYGKYLRQLNHGPALGVFQMEPNTYYDIFDNYLRYKPDMQESLFGEGVPEPIRMVHDLKFAIIMCRLHYYRVPDPLPAWDDVHALAEYWKEHYNTILGAGTVDEFVENYERFVTDN